MHLRSEDNLSKDAGHLEFLNGGNRARTESPCDASYMLCGIRASSPVKF